MQTRYLNDNAVVSKTLDKGVGKSLRHHIAVIVARLMADI